jgi:UDP-N-acetylmuramoyl-L-alanyl-D-glutamate--2,6-diaminopimelate ligase
MITIGEIANELGARVSGAGIEAQVIPARSAVTHDSRRVVPGGIFVAIQGAHTDGNRFVGEAAKRGAIAIVSEQSRPQGYAGVWIEVADARVALSRAASLVHGNPSRLMKVAGITGTNGKTTTAHLVTSISQAAGEIPAMMGTISYRIGSGEVEAEHTTPEASDIHDFLRRAHEAGARTAVMEVSSHAIDLHRVDGVDFDVAAFTNLTQDHLDYHSTLDEYFAVKRHLFDGSLGSKPASSVINIDDPRGQELVAIGGSAAMSYAISTRADIATTLGDTGFDGLNFTAVTPRGEIDVVSPLVGRPHAYNILCAIGIGLSLDYSREVIEKGIRQCQRVAGRFERVEGTDDDPTVIVDYAHTPDALANVLHTIREAMSGTDGRIITVFGCGGDRDKQKRPLMGEVAGRLSHWVIATSDNPRSEGPNMILTHVRVGLDRVGGQYELIADRRGAIFRAITRAAPQDTVLIAGKGHETYQILADGKIDFDDRLVAREALLARRPAS